jgi:hypothetical protein
MRDLRATWQFFLSPGLARDVTGSASTRARWTLPLTALLVLAGALAAPGYAAAQDDFDDEFEEDEETAPASGATDSAEAGSAEQAAAAPPADADALRAERFLAHNTWGGPTGGIRVVDAGSGPRGTFRLQLATEFFFASDFLNDGDENSHIGGSLSVSWTPFDFLEIFANLSSSANSNNTENPPLFQVLGDTTLGAKAFYTLPKVPWLTLGGDVTLALLNTVGDIGLVFKSTSLGLRGNATADFRRLRSSIPLVARFNLQYWLDNSSQLTSATRRSRIATRTTPARRATSSRAWSASRSASIASTASPSRSAWRPRSRRPSASSSAPCWSGASACRSTGRATGASTGRAIRSCRAPIRSRATTDASTCRASPRCRRR